MFVVAGDDRDEAGRDAWFAGLWCALGVIWLDDACWL